MMEIKSPMPARVISVNVNVGDSVEENTEMATVESMKMELPVYAECKGVVKEIKIEEGMTIQQGTTLFVVE